MPDYRNVKDENRRLPEQLIREATSERDTDNNVEMLSMLLNLKDGAAIGIDLGLTHCCAAIVQQNKPTVIKNEHDHNSTPHWVAFDDNDIYIGEPAKAHATKDARNSIYDLNRIAGRKYDDPAMQEVLKEPNYKVPYAIVNREGGRPQVQVTTRDGIKYRSPEQLTAMVLQRIKENAKDFLGTDATHCVLTVPSVYTEEQRRATEKAAKLCGLSVLRIINEPTAAALAYGLESESRCNILVYDLGGGSFNVTLLSVEDGVFNIRKNCTAGDSRLGGDTFDKKLADYVMDEIMKKHKQDLRKRPEAIRRILNKCEHAKKLLSQETQVQIPAYCRKHVVPAPTASVQCS